MADTEMANVSECADTNQGNLEVQEIRMSEQAPHLPDLVPEPNPQV